VRPVLIAAVVLGGCALASLKAPAKPQPDRLPDLAPVAPAGDPHAPYGVGKLPFANRASTSCAAAACHGGGQVGKLGSEHSTWAPELGAKGAGDPHNKAYRVLYNEVSVRMGELLGIKEPHKEARCLACHAVDSGGDPDTRDQILAEGVGCSGCHGPAEKWVGVHYLPEWKELPNEKKWKEYGFVPTKNLVARTLTCAKCHVGDDERDMNHDLIAAGHPRLAFEAARFHYQPDYRKHWTERMPQPEFEVREWLVGQVASLRAAAELLRSRAEKAEKADGVWPEFSEYSCYACHQKVGEEALRGVAGTNPRHAGVPGWQVWYNSTA
jgi:cytochrome c551/c552